jgi:hypothetical protein
VSFQKAKRKFENLIKFIARRYSVPGHFRLSREELIAEGELVLVRCWNDFPYGTIEFDSYFKTALYNRIKELHRFRAQIKREGEEVSIEEALHLQKVNPEIPYLDEALLVFPYISPKARRLLCTLLFSPPALSYYAYLDLQKRQKTFAAPECRIAARHIRGFLNLTPRQMDGLVREVRDAYRSQIQSGGSSLD